MPIFPARVANQNTGFASPCPLLDSIRMVNDLYLKEKPPPPPPPRMKKNVCFPLPPPPPTGEVRQTQLRDSQMSGISTSDIITGRTFNLSVLCS